jgi:hypothetical protein
MFPTAQKQNSDILVSQNFQSLSIITSLMDGVEDLVHRYAHIQDLSGAVAI